mmetsp:Transcript_47016/g.93085  ORF Transcript_47016/g.93085 Transcript_47016/m.93085 type:complete len:307 (-) Transcript_47016:802-1722(-)
MPVFQYYYSLARRRKRPRAAQQRIGLFARLPRGVGPAGGGKEGRGQQGLYGIPGLPLQALALPALPASGSAVVFVLVLVLSHAENAPEEVAGAVVEEGPRFPLAPRAPRRGLELCAEPRTLEPTLVRHLYGVHGEEQADVVSDDDGQVRHRHLVDDHPRSPKDDDQHVGKEHRQRQPEARVGGPEPVGGLPAVEDEHLNAEADLHVDYRLPVQVRLVVGCAHEGEGGDVKGEGKSHHDKAEKHREQQQPHHRGRLWGLGGLHVVVRNHNHGDVVEQGQHDDEDRVDRLVEREDKDGEEGHNLHRGR